MFNKKTIFERTCFVQLRSKVPHEDVSIMLRITRFDHDSRNAPPDVNTFYSESCSRIHDQTKHVSP